MTGDSLQKADELSLPAARLRPPASRALATSLLAVLIVVLGGALLAVPEMRDVAGVFALLLLPIVGAVAWHVGRLPAGGVGLRVSREGVLVEGRLALRREQLRRAMVVFEKGTTMVVLHTPSFVSLIDVASEAEGRAVVRALGMDPTQITSEFSFDSRAMRSIPPWSYWLYLLAPLLFIPLLLVGLYWLMPLLMLVWYAGLIVAAVPQKVVVGLDGVLLRWIGRSRLLSYDEIRSVEVDGQAVRFQLRSGEEKVVSAYWTGQPWERGWWKSTFGFGSRQAYLDTVAARIREAQVASQQGAPGSAAAWLSRRGQDPLAWIASLRGLLSKEQADFRHDAPEPEQLWATLEDARQSPSLRVAAATALASSLDPDGRQRLRVAASAVVNPGLRAALEAATQDDDDALLKALEQAESTHQEALRSRREG